VGTPPEVVPSLVVPGPIEELVGCWGSWGPTLAPGADRVAFLSDRRGRPEVWVCAATPDALPRVLELSEDPVTSVTWSADGEWLAYTVAPDGGVRTHVWVARPDGSDTKRVAGSAYEHATLGPWSRSGHSLVVSVPRASVSAVSRCDLVDPASGERERIASGGLVEVLDVSADVRFALLRGGRRGVHHCVTLDRLADQDYPLLPYPHTGSTESGLLRPATWADLPDQLTAYLVTDASLPRAALAGVDLGPDGVRGHVGILAAREDGELERIDADDAGRLLTLVWNVAGRSVLELFDTCTGERSEVAGLPGAVITGCVLARTGSSALVSVESPTSPSRLWRLDLSSRTWTPVDGSAPAPDVNLVEPTLEEFWAHDGLPLTGWLYRPYGATGPGPVLLSLHGGPEAQERPGWSAQHQALVAGGISVFAPNVRGSTGFGRQFAHADDRLGRHSAIADVRACVHHLLATGVADRDRIAVSGRSYGGYLTLAALVRYPDIFAAGVDICGMSDLLTFYRDTEPWIAEAAVSKYGHPLTDQSLLEDLSPLGRAEAIAAPLLVVHGQYDTNVPIGEARQIVAALEGLGRPVEYLELEGEGHEYRHQASRLRLMATMAAFLEQHLIAAEPASTGSEALAQTG
jgi:dipeptidyl aminopeptidase/acylaminoacyl peptidase